MPLTIGGNVKKVLIKENNSFIVGISVILFVKSNLDHKHYYKCDKWGGVQVLFYQVCTESKLGWTESGLNLLNHI